MLVSFLETKTHANKSKRTVVTRFALFKGHEGNKMKFCSAKNVFLEYPRIRAELHATCLKIPKNWNCGVEDIKGGLFINEQDTQWIPAVSEGLRSHWTFGLQLYEILESHLWRKSDS